MNCRGTEAYDSSKFSSWTGLPSQKICFCLVYAEKLFFGHYSLKKCLFIRLKGSLFGDPEPIYGGTGGYDSLKWCSWKDHSPPVIKALPANT